MAPYLALTRVMRRITESVKCSVRVDNGCIYIPSLDKNKNGGEIYPQRCALRPMQERYDQTVSSIWFPSIAAMQLS